MKLETLLKRYHFSNLAELDEFLRIMRIHLYHGSMEYTKNCYVQSIDLDVHCDINTNEKTKNYTFLDEWLKKNNDGKHFKDLSERDFDSYLNRLRKENPDNIKPMFEAILNNVIQY